MRPRWNMAVLAIAAVIAISLPASASAQDAEHRYTGTKKCKTCHFKEHKSWKETKMAKVFELLKPGVRAEAKTKAGLEPNRDYTADPECLPCHTVGYGKKGGFVDMDETPDHAGVGCEMCHGPGGTYTASGQMTLKNREYKRSDLVAAGLVGKVGPEQCAVCHNEKSPFVEPGAAFDYEAKKSEGTHKTYPLKYSHE